MMHRAFVAALAVKAEVFVHHEHPISGVGELLRGDRCPEIGEVREQVKLVEQLVCDLLRGQDADAQLVVVGDVAQIAFSDSTTVPFSFGIQRIQLLSHCIHRFYRRAAYPLPLRFKQNREQFQLRFSLFICRDRQENHFALTVSGNIDRLLPLGRKLYEVVVIVAQCGRRFNQHKIAPFPYRYFIFIIR